MDFDLLYGKVKFDSECIYMGKIFKCSFSVTVLAEMFNIMRPWSYISTKCQADLWPFVQGHSFGLPHTYLIGNVSGNRCKSDCRSWDREFDPGPVPYFRGDWSWNNFYGHSPFRWIIQEGLLSVTNESMCTKYWLTACSSLPRKKCG